jgi:hypothetical protein
LKGNNGHVVVPKGWIGKEVIVKQIAAAVTLAISSSILDGNIEEKYN